MQQENLCVLEIKRAVHVVIPASQIFSFFLGLEGRLETPFVLNYPAKTQLAANIRPSNFNLIPADGMEMYSLILVNAAVSFPK